MGGGTVSGQSSTTHDDDLFTDFSYPFDQNATLRPGGLSSETAELNESVFINHDETTGIEANEKRVYAQVIKSYDDLKLRTLNLEAAKSKVLSYKPGSWIEKVGGMTKSDYKVPKTTTLLLIGPKGSGKSSLVNRISRVFEDDKFAPERARVTYNSSVSDGTRYLQEYMIPRNSTSFCLYDTRGFSDGWLANLEMIMQWMIKGVRHGEFVKSVSDSSSLLAQAVETREDNLLAYKRRRVDSVIFVVNGLSVLNCMENSGPETNYMDMVTRAFRSPCLSFKDHKPAVAITHGDLLSISERARVRVYLGRHLGIHPSKQIYDIPDNCESTTELTIIDLVRYALEHADRNLPLKSRPLISKGEMILTWAVFLLILAMGIGTIARLHSVKSHQESFSVRSPEIKKFPECGQQNDLEPGLEVNKLPEFRQQNDPEPDPEVKKFLESGQKNDPEPDPEMKEYPESGQQHDPEPDPEMKKAAEIAMAHKNNLERKEDVPRKNSKPSKKEKKVEAESIHGKKQNTKKVPVPEPALKIDWKNIRHLWYAVPEPALKIDWKKIRHLWYV